MPAHSISRGPSTGWRRYALAASSDEIAKVLDIWLVWFGVEAEGRFIAEPPREVVGTAAHEL
jgi:hypothetical protein